MTRPISRFPRRKSSPRDAARMTLAQLAEAAGETIHTVRYYTRVGLVAPAQIAANGYRQFDGVALKRLAFIRRAQRLGFTLEEIASFIDDARRGHTPCPRVRRLLEARLPAISTRAAEAQALLMRMQAAARRWKKRPDVPPAGHEVCRLIEDGAER